MNILIISPLYPPDIAPLAVYVKEVARRLATADHVTIICYSHIPEAIAGVRIIPVSKNSILPVRLLSFMVALWKEVRNADVLYVQNGASVELPVSLVTCFIHTPSVTRLGDPVALTTARTRLVMGTILNFMMRQSTRIVSDGTYAISPQYQKKMLLLNMPDTRPEILPFQKYPEDAFRTYEQSWDEHVTKLRDTFTHAQH